MKCVKLNFLKNKGKNKMKIFEKVAEKMENKKIRDNVATLFGAAVLIGGVWTAGSVLDYAVQEQAKSRKSYSGWVSNIKQFETYNIVEVSIDTCITDDFEGDKDAKILFHLDKAAHAAIFREMQINSYVDFVMNKHDDFTQRVPVSFIREIDGRKVGR
jgi:hypothetical protein